MRDVLPRVLELARLTGDPAYHSHAGRRYGAFELMGPKGTRLLIVSSGEFNAESPDWEHVSVSASKRTPNWQEMCFVKSLFWADDECVVQYHPPEAVHVNNHPFTLHLWKAREGFPMPPQEFV